MASVERLGLQMLHAEEEGVESDRKMEDGHGYGLAFSFRPTARCSTSTRMSRCMWSRMASLSATQGYSAAQGRNCELLEKGRGQEYGGVGGDGGEVGE